MQPLYPPAGPQSIGQALDSGFRIFQVSLVKCLLYGAVSMIAGQLPSIYLIATGRPLTSFGGGGPVGLLLFLLAGVATLRIYSALLYRQHGIAVGQFLGMRRELSLALRKLPAAIGMTLVIVAILLIGPVVLAIVLRILGIDLSTPSYGLLAVCAVLAVPLIYIATPLAFAAFALLLDGKGPVSAINYAVRLTRGNWWRATAIPTVGFVLAVVFSMVAMIIVGMVLPLVGASDLASVTAASSVVTVVVGSIVLPFLSAVFLAAYGDLKVRREGVDLEKRVASLAS
jgi:hypothetical protein